MQNDHNFPVNPQQRRPEDATFESQPDLTPRREGGADSLAEAAPTDSRADEKVIVNSQTEDKIVNNDSPTNSDQQSSSSGNVTNAGSSDLK
jgi:hypothetical protein